ncbi:hypothetical protein [Acuticoccus kandeliae]|uniref:hypothetical protein n=1 Tax=Acuticoccus kandeliae TaxID=2073160 RepID=UPI000D3E3325|nr:hypothetical protein [Acuticoccus kandeliae]
MQHESISDRARQAAERQESIDADTGEITEVQQDANSGALPQEETMQAIGGKAAEDATARLADEDL